MFKNSYYDARSSTIYLWEQIKGENMFTEIPWVPYVFIPHEKGSVKTIHGNPARKRHFTNYSDYNIWIKGKQDIFEDRVRPEIQFLAERYHGIPDIDIEVPKLKTYFIDIEIKMEVGFPDTREAKEEICLITIHDNSTNTAVTFGEKPYNGKYKDQKFFTYFHCGDEETLLRRFFNFMHKFPCDVISGWSVQFFDLPYIINRSKKVFGNDDMYQRLSPVKIVRTWESQDRRREEINIDIAGLTILDYLDLYKWYAPEKLERYSLEYVSNYELEKGKVDLSEYKDHRELYEKNWDLYVEYNVIDALRPSQLEDKLGYIKQVQALSLLCKSPMRYYHTMTQLIEGLMLTYFRRNGFVAPKFIGGTQETFEAAYVKEPIKGMYDWIVDLDIASSYPSAIITLNMSPETYYGRILDITEDNVIQYVRQKKFPEMHILRDNGSKILFSGKRLDTFNDALENKVITVAPCGSIFSTKQTGVIPAIERQLFDKRKDVKSKMIKMKKSLTSLRDENLKTTQEKIMQQDSFQNALKIILNAIFGVTSVPYSRYFNVNISEAITSCGRQTIKAGERAVNHLLNKPNDQIVEMLNEMKQKI
jgi:DNA polymerase elongation subunit (family B)